MKVTETKIPGVLIIDTDVFGDHRGYFTETYSKPKYEKMGITVDFVQDNMSLVRRRVRFVVCTGKIRLMRRVNWFLVRRVQ